MSTLKKEKVFVALSGGVDSSVAALLLQKDGYDVTGVFMRCYNLDGCAERDAEDARRVTEKLGIPFYVWDFENEYKRSVVNYMIEGYRQGITPNPDVMCNKEIKFGLFLKKALDAGANYVATGHYVRLISHSQHREKFAPLGLQEAKDKNKDQSYFLWTLTQDRLKHCLFPIGDYLKAQVREIARRAGLPTAEKKDSQGICFLGQVVLGEFLSRQITEREGDVVSVDGNKVGKHKGAEFYTIGQRRIGIKNQELGIKGRHETKPYYVVEKDIESNTIVVAEGNDNPALYRKEIELTDVNFINSNPLSVTDSTLVHVRIRYRQPLVRSRIKNEKSKIKLEFDEPVKFVAPGQSAVFYAKDGPASAGASSGREMLGGGIII